jgi:hypothetical protein
VTGAAKPGRPKLTQQERRRRKARRAWIPTGIIAGLIVVAIIVAIVVQNGGSGKPVVETAGDTRFNAEGVASILKDADAQIDVRGPRPASAIDLPANSSKNFGPFNGISAELDLVGTNGIQSLYVDSFRITTRDNLLTTISTTSTEFGFAEIHDQLEAESVVGITTKQMAAFENAMPVGAGGPKSFFTLKLGTGTALGIPTRVSVTCAGPKGCTVTTLTTLKQK